MNFKQLSILLDIYSLEVSLELYMELFRKDSSIINLLSKSRTKDSLENDNNDDIGRLTVDNEIQWTRSEKDLFWSIIESHIRHLLVKNDCTVNRVCGIDINYNELDPMSLTDYCKCRTIIRTNLWIGEYQKAVGQYLVAEEFFYIMFGAKMSIEQKLEELKSIYLNPYYFGHRCTV